MPYFSPFRDDHSKKCCNIHTPTTITISLWGLTRNAARMILVTFSLTDSWRMSDRTGMILYRRRCSHIWGLNARSHIEKIIWYWSWKPHLLLKTPIMLKKNRGGGKKIFHTSTSKKKKYAYTEGASLWTVFSFLSSSYSTQLMHSQTTTH